MPREISLTELQSMAPAVEQPGKPKRKELTLDELNATLAPKKEEPTFWGGAKATIAGQLAKTVKGVQIEAAETDPENDDLLKSYNKDLGDALRAQSMEASSGIKSGPATRRVNDLRKLITETQARIDKRNAAPKVKERVSELQNTIRIINEDIAEKTPRDMGFWKSSVFNAVTSIGTMAPALAGGILTGGAAIPLTVIGLQTYASSYADNRTKGLDKQKSAQLAAIDGLTEVLTELLPTSRLIKAPGLLKKFLEATIADVPGEVLANYIQNATAAVAGLGTNPSDEAVKKALQDSARKSTKEIGTTAASTMMAGGALAGTVAAAQAGGKKKEEPVPPNKKPPKQETPPPQEPQKKKPHFKSPAEAKAAMEAKLPEGADPVVDEEFAELDELLAQPLADKAGAEVVDFAAAKEARKSPEQKLKDLDAAWVAGDISSEEHTQKRSDLHVEELTAIRDQALESNKKQNAHNRSTIQNLRTDLAEAARSRGLPETLVNKLDAPLLDELNKVDGPAVQQKQQAEILKMVSEESARARRAGFKLIYPGENQTSIADMTDEELKKAREDLWKKVYNKEITYDQLHKMSQPYLDESFKREQAAREQAVKGKTEEIAPGYGPRLRVGTAVTASHGLKYPDPVRVKIVGHRKPIKTRFSGVVIPHLAEFPDGKVRTITRWNIKEVHGPKPFNAPALSPSDKRQQTSTKMSMHLYKMHDTIQPMWEFLANKASDIAHNAKALGKKGFHARTASAHAIIDRMLKYADGPYKDLMKKLKEYTPEDLPIHFQWVDKGEGLVTVDGKTMPSNWGGVYDSTNDSIVMKVNEEAFKSPEFTKNVMHELWHAITYKYLLEHPNSPITKRLELLWKEAVKATDELQKELRDSGMSNEAVDELLGGVLTIGENGEVGTTAWMYGFTNVAEMIAEAHTNPVFMHTLAKASPRAKGLWQKLVSIFHETAGQIAKALGFSEREAGLLHQIFEATEELAFAQHLERGVAKEVGKGKKVAGAETSDRTSETPYNRQGQLKTKPSVATAVALLTKATSKIPGIPTLTKKVDEYLREARRNVAPETLGPKATQSAAILSKWIVNQMKNDASYHHQSKTRRDFWEKNAEHARAFIKALEGGWVPKDPKFREIAEAYRQWNNDIMQSDLAKGIEYDAHDNYLYHVFKEKDKLADYMQRKFGQKWGDPRFMKDRSYDMYEEAIKAGFTPEFTNPEDIMLARQHSSEIAHMKIATLEELKESGLAWEEKPTSFETVAWRSPNGKQFYVHHEAAGVLHNAWATDSLWSRKGLVGDVFKGAMYLKNRIVPIKLFLSLFHFLHVLTIHNATGMVRATKGLMNGDVGVGTWMKEMGKATAYSGMIDDPKFGGRIRAIFLGEIPVENILPHEAQAIQYMVEGGMLPEQSHQYKSNAKTAFRNAMLRVRKQPWAAGRMAYETTFAAMDWMQHWMFEKWIPSIKTASYLKDVHTALEADPSLLHDQQRRQVVFHKLAKSVDNRYGEMVYKTMFWNKWMKDLAVVNLLSLGWQMGFIREYGGAVGDLKNLATKQGDLPTKIKAGQLDRPLFVTLYTAQSLMYAGLLTWALSGEPPDEWKDYIYPKDGGKNPDGTDRRVNTMFYAREFAAIAEHIKQDGVMGGLSKTAANKASGIFGLAWQSYSGVDDFGKEYRDPNGSAVEKVAQTMDFVLGEMTPISVGGIMKDGGDPKSLAMNVAGFSKAPGYATMGPAESEIRHVWQKYNAKTQTPYERAVYSKDMRELRELRDSGDEQGMGVKLDEMTANYQLNASERKRIRKNLRSTNTPEQTMFQSLTWQQQKRLLDKMSDEDREKYLRFSNKAHLRRRYEAPEEVD